MHTNEAASSDLESLRDFLKMRGVSCVKIQQHHATDLDFMLHVPSDCVSTRAGHGRTSVHQLDRLRAEIKKRLALSVDWIITEDDRVSSLKSALLGALETRFPGVFATVFMSLFQKSPITVWVDADPHVMNRPSEKELNKIAANIFSAFGLEHPRTRYVYTSEVPNTQMILRSLKVRSPATVKDLAEWMRKRDVQIPDIKWLQRKLDTLRKNRLVVRMHDGTYATTEESLRILPGDRSRSSSDVERALVLSRVTW